MRTPSPVKAGGFYREHGLPDEYYAFTDGELSLTVERCGGINSLKVLDILAWHGKLYPDRTATPPIFAREGNVCGNRPLYGPAVQFISESARPDGRPGRVLHHFPDRTELYPFGFHSESERFGHRLGYDLCIDGRAVCCRFTNAHPDRDRLLVSINKDHIVSGVLNDPWCMKTQIWSEWLPPDLAGQTGYPEMIPTTGRLKLTWDFIGYDPGVGGFVMDGEMAFAYGAKRVAVVIKGSRAMEYRDAKTRHVLSLPWNRHQAEDEIRLCLAIDPDRAAAARRAEALNAEGVSVLIRKTEAAVDAAERVPRLSIASLPAAAEYARTLPAFEHAMVLAETETEACIRAATHKFGYFPQWDQLYPARALLPMGDAKLSKKLIRYLVDTPNAETNYLQMIPTTDEYVGFSGDRGFLREVYPDYRRYFMLMAQGVDARTGFIRTENGYGSDFAAELGIEGLIWAPCANGWWYNACRAMENFAILLDDDEAERAAHEVGRRVLAHYLPTFFDEQRGYLAYAVEPATGRRVPVFQNVSTMALDFPYGEYLLSGRLGAIAEYQACALCHPNGRASVAHHDDAHEMWKNVIMFQHLAHEAKAARAAGLGDEALRIVGTYMCLFDRYKVGIETYNLTGCDGDSSQRANWQAFASAYCALIEGILGIQWDLGGFGYAPCAMEGEMALEGFRFRDTVWDIHVGGSGAHVGCVTIDGSPVHGTTRMTGELLSGRDRHELRIVCSNRPFSRPTLLRACGAAIIDLQSKEDVLSFGVAERVHAPIKATCPSRPRVTVGGRPVESRWDAATGVVWCDAVVAPGERVEIGQ